MLLSGWQPPAVWLPTNNRYLPAENGEGVYVDGKAKQGRNIGLPPELCDDTRWPNKFRTYDL